ncbi:MAG TPA: tetratricopeptide repeat protein [Myxococcaceae bacterium]|nr:tetratricopeptide repeat protein [Myxococcaceae bacterium]
MLAVVMAGLLLSTPPGDVEQARADFERGAALYRAGDFRAALGAFEAAQARAPTPQALFNIARCQERLGQLADAVDSYSAYLASAPDAPDHTAVSARIDELRARLPLEASLRISVEPPASVAIDGEPAGLSPVSARLRPGPHRVRATQEGYQPLERDVELAPGARVQLELSLVALVPSVAATERAPEGAVRDTVAPVARTQPRRWTYVAAGLAAACLAAGVAFGLSAHQAQDTLKDGTPRSPEQVQQIYDTAVARSNAANGFYAAAGITGAAAVALFFLEPHFGAPPEAR